MDARTITTGKVRLSFANLFTPKAALGSDVEKYSVSIVIPKSDKQTLAKIKSAIEAAKEDGKSSKWHGTIPKNIKLPLRDGDEDRPDDVNYANSYFINASNKQKPSVVDRNLNPILDPDEVYSGCYARVNITFYAFDVNGNRGVAASLGPVQKVADGEPLTGRVSVEAAFGDSFEDDDEIID